VHSIQGFLLQNESLTPPYMLRNCPTFFWSFENNNRLIPFRRVTTTLKHAYNGASRDRLLFPLQAVSFKTGTPSYVKLIRRLKASR